MIIQIIKSKYVFKLLVVVVDVVDVVVQGVVALNN
jgi:hypothetical protein